ncbi:rRNA methyltransferase 3, mitochondrial [Brevipalpus obovatus]|uniref:rRNA methyltransferase 3, mitochondrial n=1 Tax=Brevipalpus obovatus TaxID=246614 RepID=UPI003D9F6DD9
MNSIHCKSFRTVSSQLMSYLNVTLSNQNMDQIRRRITTGMMKPTSGRKLPGITIRTPLKILDDEGKPFYPEPDIGSMATSPPGLVREQTRDKRSKFNPKIYEDYINKLAGKNLKSWDVIPGFKYARIQEKHRDYIEAKLIAKKISRMRKELIVLEGKRLMNDAISCGMTVEKIFFNNLNMLQQLIEIPRLIHDGTQFFQITEAAMRKLSTLETPPGILGIFCRQSEQESITRSTSLPLIVIGDNIRDPGNMGTLIRSAAAVGAERLLCTPGCVDPWETKVVRAGCGAHFRVNIQENFEWANINQYLPVTESRILFATKVDQYDESLDKPAQPKVPRLKQAKYFELDYRPIQQNRIIGVVIGGETHGIDERAYEVTAMHEKFQVSIPLMKGVESLNSAVAASIILFEIQRQILNRS